MPWEQTVFDDNGRTMNPSFVDYVMTTINMMPRIETLPPSPGNVLRGLKEAGKA